MQAQPLPNVARGCAPDASLGFGSIIKAAATSFKQLYPEAEASFLALDSAGVLFVIEHHYRLDFVLGFASNARVQWQLNFS